MAVAIHQIRPVAHLLLVLGVVRKLQVAALIETFCPPHPAHVLSCGPQQGSALRDFGWGWPGVSGWGRGVPQRCWGDGLGKGDLGRLEGSEGTRNCTRAEG
jgi:hypothetical protein